MKVSRKIVEQITVDDIVQITLMFHHIGGQATPVAQVLSSNSEDPATKIEFTRVARHILDYWSCYTKESDSGYGSYRRPYWSEARGYLTVYLSNGDIAKVILTTDCIQRLGFEQYNATPVVDLSALKPQLIEVLTPVLRDDISKMLTLQEVSAIVAARLHAYYENIDSITCTTIQPDGSTASLQINGEAELVSMCERISSQCHCGYLPHFVYDPEGRGLTLSFTITHGICGVEITYKKALGLWECLYIKKNSKDYIDIRQMYSNAESDIAYLYSEIESTETKDEPTKKRYKGGVGVVRYTDTGSVSVQFVAFDMDHNKYVAQCRTQFGNVLYVELNEDQLCQYIDLEWTGENPEEIFADHMNTIVAIGEVWEAAIYLANGICSPDTLNRTDFVRF